VAGNNAGLARYSHGSYGNDGLFSAGTGSVDLPPVAGGALSKQWRTAMKVHDVMTPLVVSVYAEVKVAEAAQLMRTNNVGFLPVRQKRHVVGVVTDRDIAVRAAAPGLDVRRTAVSDVMTPLVETVSQGSETVEASRIMEKKGVSRLMVVDHRDKPVGLVSLGDIRQDTN
jgi:CBS domain-containing protein